MPTNDANLETDYTAQDVTDVETIDTNRVCQNATNQYAIHLFKDYYSGSIGTIRWNGRSTMSCVTSTIYLQIYNRSVSEICDSYNESNLSVSGNSMYTPYKESQSFTGNGGILKSLKMFLKKIGSPSGNINAYIYSHSGEYGVSSVPNALLATSETTLDAATYLTESYKECEFIFSGINKIRLEVGTKYCLVIAFDGGTGVDVVNIGTDWDTPTHSGNIAEWTGSEWDTSSYGTYDYIFYVYVDKWETIDSDTTTVENTDIDLEANIADLTNYKDGNNVVCCRVYQEAK